MQLTDSDLLKYAVESGIINLETVQEKIKMNERKKYLDGHNFKIWKGSDGKYYTYLPDKNTNSGRKLVKKNKREDLDDAIVKFYKEYTYEPTLGEVFDMWVSQKLKYKEIKLQTAQRYEQDYDRFFRDNPISTMRMAYITSDILEDFIRSTICDYELTAKSWAKARLILCGIFKYGAKHGYTKISITSFLGDLDLSKRVFQRKIKDPRKSVFTDEEVQMIKELAYLEDKITGYGVVLAFQTGLRAGELSALTWDCISGNIIRVEKMEEKHLDENKKTVYEVVEDTKTLAGNRDVIITDDAVETLKSIRKLNPFGKYVFEKCGERVNGHTISCKLYKMCIKLGIERRSLHKARKTYATHLIDAGVPESIIKQQMGHTDITTTREFYYFNNKNVEDVEKILKNAFSA